MTPALMLTGCGWWTPPAPALDEALRCADADVPGCFVYVPGGQVDSRDVQGLWVQRHEGTAGALARCIVGSCPPGSVDDHGPLATVGGPPEVAAVGLSWEAAHAWCASQGARLPTGDEWTLAASGGDDRPYPWGTTAHCAPLSDADRQRVMQAVDRTLRLCEAWVDDTATPASLRAMCAAPQAHRPEDVVEAARAHLGEAPLLSTGCAPSEPRPVTDDDGAEHPYGLLWMAGNAAEWVADPRDDGARTLRGGGWLAAEARDLRIDQPAGGPPDLPLPDAGVRCVRDGAPP